MRGVGDLHVGGACGRAEGERQGGELASDARSLAVQSARTGLTSDQTIDTQPRKGDEKLLLLSVGEGDSEDGVSALLDDDGGERERGLLARGSLKRNTFGLVLDEVGGDGRVVGDLLDNQDGLSSVIDARPRSVEDPGRREGGRSAS